MREREHTEVRMRKTRWKRGEEKGGAFQRKSTEPIQSKISAYYSNCLIFHFK